MVRFQNSEELILSKIGIINQATQTNTRKKMKGVIIKRESSRKWVRNLSS
ncbi:MAG: hypothetical protein AB7S37_07755 [Methanobacteriales archaeon]|nr:hypothetical protein [Methanothermobacter sp.]